MFLNKSTSSKLIVTLQSIEDIKNTNLLKQFDAVLLGRGIQNSFIDLKQGIFILSEDIHLKS